MAAPSTGHRSTDHLRTQALAEEAGAFAATVLAPGGCLVVKVLRGGAGKSLLSVLQRDFARVQHVKPEASRRQSSEIYVVARGFRRNALRDPARVRPLLPGTRFLVRSVRQGDSGRGPGQVVPRAPRASGGRLRVSSIVRQGSSATTVIVRSPGHTGIPGTALMEAHARGIVRGGMARLQQLKAVPGSPRAGENLTGCVFTRCQPCSEGADQIFVPNLAFEVMFQFVCSAPQAALLAARPRRRLPPSMPR